MTDSMDTNKDKLDISELIKYLKQTPGETIRKGVTVKSIVIGKSSRGEWKYTLNYYTPTNDITILLKRFERQPSSYAILKISDKITEVEDIDTLLEKVRKIYNLIVSLKKELKVEDKIKKIYYI